VRALKEKANCLAFDSGFEGRALFAEAVRKANREAPARRGIPVPRQQLLKRGLNKEKG